MYFKEFLLLLFSAKHKNGIFLILNILFNLCSQKSPCLSEKCHPLQAFKVELSLPHKDISFDTTKK